MMLNAPFAYIVLTDVDPDWDDEVNRWWDTEHIPMLLENPGYVSARRFVAADASPKYLTVYEIESAAAFRDARTSRAMTTPWRERLLPYRRSELVLLEAIFPTDASMPGLAVTGEVEGLFAVRVDVDPVHEADYNAFYNQEHLTDLCGLPNTVRARRYRSVDASPKYVNLIYLDDGEVLTRTDRPRLVVSPWRERIRPHLRNHWNGAYRAWRPDLVSS